MWPGRLIWFIAILLAAGLTGALLRTNELKGIAVPVGLLVLISFGLVAEVARSLKREPTVVDERFRPADGVVEILPLAGVESRPLAGLPRFRQFLRLENVSEPSRPVHRLPDHRPRLLGQVALISIFIGRDGRDWTDEEMAHAYAGLELAGVWIEREAIRHGASVNLGLAEVVFRASDDEDDAVEVAFGIEGDDVGPLEAHASLKAIASASRAAASLGFDDFVDLVSRVASLVDAEAVVWVMHVRRAGRSFAITADQSEIPGIGLAVCYAKESSFPEPLIGRGRVVPSTVAHEVLHLFGASDKYGVRLGSFPPGSVTSSDVMRLNHDRLTRMRIDPLTAREIGWNSVQGKKKALRESR